MGNSTLKQVLIIAGGIVAGMFALSLVGRIL